jgi:uncharacterized protein (TIGR03435 family)
MEWTMSDQPRTSDVVALRPFVPAKYFETSMSFYKDLGFTAFPLSDSLASMHLGPFTFLLQKFDAGLKSHLETKEGEVYILTRSRKPLQLKPPKDPELDPRAIVMMKQGGIADGEAQGTNTTTDYLALRLSRYLQLPVLNQTGIIGTYDYYLPPDDPENHDVVAAVMDVVDRLGLKIKRGRGPIQTLVIDHIEQPSEN